LLASKIPYKETKPSFADAGEVSKKIEDKLNGLNKDLITKVFSGFSEMHNFFYSDDSPAGEKGLYKVSQNEIEKFFFIKDSSSKLEKEWQNYLAQLHTLRKILLTTIENMHYSTVSAPYSKIKQSNNKSDQVEYYQPSWRFSAFITTDPTGVEIVDHQNNIRKNIAGIFTGSKEFRGYKRVAFSPGNRFIALGDYRANEG